MPVNEEKIAANVVQRVLDRVIDYVETRVINEFVSYSAKQPAFLQKYCDAKISDISSVKNVLYSREAVSLSDIYVPALLELRPMGGRPIFAKDTTFSDHLFGVITRSEVEEAAQKALPQIYSDAEITGDGINPEIAAELMAGQDEVRKRKTPAYIISGSAGAGKTIFLKNICRRAIPAERVYLPIYMEVRRLHDPSDLESSIVHELNSYGSEVISSKYLLAALRIGLFAICIDGFDEVHPDHRFSLEPEIRRFATKYDLCPIVVSGREMTAYHSWEGFSVAEICELSIHSAIELIKKSHVPDLDKKGLVAYIRNDIPKGYLEFLKNPLMVTVLILTATEVNRVSDNLMNFLEDAFEALWWRHDVKKSGFARVASSRLGKMDFKKFFSVFCAASYFAEAIEMSETSLLGFVSRAKDRMSIDASEEELIYDMRISVCLLVRDGGRYLFAHRLFQEYFCALFINSLGADQYLKSLDAAGRRAATDEVLRFVRELDQDKVERDFVLPLLGSLLNEYKIDRCSDSAYQKLALRNEGQLYA